MMIKCSCTRMRFLGVDSVLNGHHVNCDTNTEKIEMAKVEFDGRWCVMDVGDALDSLRDIDNDDEYKFRKVWMTKNELDALPEFTG